VSENLKVRQSERAKQLR